MDSLNKKSTFIQQQILPLISFVKRPHYSFGKKDTLRTRIIGCITIFVLITVWNNAVSLWDVSSFIDAHYLEKPVSTESGWFSLFMSTMLLAPILEEFMFRAHLKSILGSLFFYASLMAIVLANFIAQLANIHTGMTILILIFLLLGIPLIIIFSLYPGIRKQYAFRPLLIRYYPYHVWFSVILFALVHTLRYRYFSSTAVVLSPLLVLPQFFGGIMLAYVRVRFGLVYSIILHVLNNGLILTAIYFK